MNELLFSFYKTAFLSIVRGNHRGVVINAKPLYYITIIDQIGKGEDVTNNKIPFSETLNEAYLSICKEYQPDIIPTPFFKPYYYSKNEQFYHLKYKKEPPQTGPSAKFVRDNIEYAYFDNALWDLLQEPEVRQQLREAIIRHFFPGHTAASVPLMVAEPASTFGNTTKYHLTTHIEPTKEVATCMERTTESKTLMTDK